MNTSVLKQFGSQTKFCSTKFCFYSQTTSDKKHNHSPTNTNLAIFPKTGKQIKFMNQGPTAPMAKGARHCKFK